MTHSSQVKCVQNTYYTVHAAVILSWVPGQNQAFTYSKPHDCLVLKESNHLEHKEIYRHYPLAKPGQWLTDSLINAGQAFLKDKFPAVHGLQENYLSFNHRMVASLSKYWSVKISTAGYAYQLSTASRRSMTAWGLVTFPQVPRSRLLLFSTVLLILCILHVVLCIYQTMSPQYPSLLIFFFVFILLDLTPYFLFNTYCAGLSTYINFILIPLTMDSTK